MDGLTFEGDSLTADPGGGHTPYPDILIPNLYADTNRRMWWNVATAGHKASDIVSQGSQTDTHYGSLFGKNIAVLWAGTNDIFHSADTAAAIYANLTTWIQARQAAGFRVIVLTVLPSNYATKPADFDTRQAALNVLILANSAGAQAVVNVAGDALLSDPNNTTYYQSDKLHLTTAGETVVAGLVQTAIAGV